MSKLTNMTEIEQASQALIAAIDAARRRLPHRRGDAEARHAVDCVERDLLALCENAKILIHQQCKRIKLRASSRSQRKWTERRRVLSKEQKREPQQRDDASQ